MAEKAVLAKFLGLKEKSLDKTGAKEPGKVELGELSGKGKFSTKARYQLTIDSAKQGGVEKYYYWMEGFMRARLPFGINLREDFGYIVKVKDIFTATETSSYWGNIEQRKGAQQEKVSQYLGTIGKMLKDTFQIVRELRILDERLEYYIGVDKGDKAADFALKGIWVDMVEGGAKNPGSVYGLANTVGFITLPDLFFSTFVKKSSDVTDVLDKDGKLQAFNRKVREVLARKLKQYLIWKEKTQKELEVRKNFTLKYLRQHYNTIRLYTNWVSPYLRNIQRLQMEGRSLSDSELVTAFETSKVELELLGVYTKYRRDIYSHYEEWTPFKKYFPVIRLRVNFVSIPQMVFQSEYQRGPIHAGKTTIIMEGYVSTKKQLDEYIKSVQEEDLELLSSLFEVMDAMKDDMKKYLEEAGEKFTLFDAAPKEATKESVFDPFKAAFSGFKGIFSMFAPGKSSSDEVGYPEEKSKAEGMAGALTYRFYYVFKKSQRYVTE